MNIFLGITPKGGEYFFKTNCKFSEIDWENVTTDFFDNIDAVAPAYYRMEEENIKLTGRKYKFKDRHIFYSSYLEFGQLYKYEFQIDCFWETEPIMPPYITIRNDLIPGKLYGYESAYDVNRWTEQMDKELSGKTLPIKWYGYSGYYANYLFYYPKLRDKTYLHLTRKMIVYDNYGKLNRFIKSNNEKFVIKFYDDEEITNICNILDLSSKNMLKEREHIHGKLYYCPKTSSLMDMYEVANGSYKVFDYHNFTW